MSGWIASGGASVAIATLLGGATVSAAHLGALWWSIRRCAGKDHPAVGLVASGAARLAFVLVALTTLSGGDAVRFVLALIGFVGLRLAVTRSVVTLVQETAR